MPKGRKNPGKVKFQEFGNVSKNPGFIFDSYFQDLLKTKIK